MYKTAEGKKEKKNKQTNGEIFNVHGKEDSIVTRYLFSPTWSIQSIPIKIPESYFVGVNKLILKFIHRGKIPRIANTIEGEQQSWRTDALWFQKTNYKCRETTMY